MKNHPIRYWNEPEMKYRQGLQEAREEKLKYKKKYEEEKAKNKKFTDIFDEALFLGPNASDIIRETYFSTIDKQKNEIKELEKQIEELKKVQEKELRELRNEFEQKFKQLEKEKDDIFKKEIQKRDKEIFTLKEKLNMNPKWQKRGNTYWRWNPDLQKEDEPVILPRNFDIRKVDIKSYNKEKTIITYEYLDNTIIPPKKRKMPRSLYDQLLEEQKIKDKKKRLYSLDIHNVKTWEDMKDYIYSIGDVPRGKQIENLGRFIIKKHYGSGEFTTDEIDRECHYTKTQRKKRREHCKKFIKWGFIADATKQGHYKIIF